MRLATIRTAKGTRSVRIDDDAAIENAGVDQLFLELSGAAEGAIAGEFAHAVDVLHTAQQRVQAAGSVRDDIAKICGVDLLRQVADDRVANHGHRSRIAVCHQLIGYDG